MLQPPPPDEAFSWARAARELLGFVASFLFYGAAAFGTLILRGDAAHRPIVLRRATDAGLGGVLLSLLVTLMGLVTTAAEKKLTLGAAVVAGGGPLAWRLACFGLAIVGLVLARFGRPAGWSLAALGALGVSLRNVVTGDWTRLINPLHVLAGGLWIGTLFVLVVAALSPTVRRAWAEGSHGASIAMLVRRFSTLALASSALLALTGVITAWRHLKHVENLWRTPYGWALCMKLLLVAAVAALGAFNWRAQSPRLGDDASTDAIRRSSRTELALALAVLVVTSILVSIPAPKS